MPPGPLKLTSEQFVYLNSRLRPRFSELRQGYVVYYQTKLGVRDEKDLQKIEELLQQRRASTQSHIACDSAQGMRADKAIPLRNIYDADIEAGAEDLLKYRTYYLLEPPKVFYI